MNIPLLSGTALFQGMSDEEIRAAVKECAAYEVQADKGETLLQAGQTTECLGLVLEGGLTIENNDFWGNKTILSYVERNQFFAETYAFLKTQRLQVDVVADTPVRVLFLHIGKLDAGRNEPWCRKLLYNLLTISTQKNILLSQRSFIISAKTIRRRVMSFLNTVYIQQGTKELVIPFNRQQLADYLNVERTALSKELKKMKDDHLIDVQKNTFTLLTK
ncbi:MAG: Crp/Fnr family transcriptional regulator [Erysipelotrichaceae bacterium]|nr:Crp/Fnr family transcriptional regulator [Erysipelotrichaceae bacterium]